MLKLDFSELKSLPESIGNLSSLVKLVLEYTGISEFPESIGRLKNLKMLFVKETRISRLPASFKELTGLEKLDLDGTNISKYAEETASFLHNMPNLKSYRFSVCSENGYEDDIFDRFISHEDSE